MKRLFSLLSGTLVLLLSSHLSSGQVMYGTTRLGGATDEGTIFRINCDHATHEVVYSFGADNNQGIRPYGSLVRHSNGNLYGVSKFGGPSDLGVIYEFIPSTRVYTRKFSFTGYNGWNSYGSLVEAPNGKLYGTTANGGMNEDAHSSNSIRLPAHTLL